MSALESWPWRWCRRAIGTQGGAVDRLENQAALVVLDERTVSAVAPGCAATSNAVQGAVVLRRVGRSEYGWLVYGPSVARFSAGTERALVYAARQCSSQYGFPTRAMWPQNWNAAVPGSPNGQQHGLRPAGDGALRSGARRQGGVGSGRVAAASVHALRGMMSASFGTDNRRGRADDVPKPVRVIGDARLGRSRRCALPTTAFFETPRRRPISASNVLLPRIGAAWRPYRRSNRCLRSWCASGSPAAALAPRPLFRVGRRRAGQGRRLAPGPTLARRGAGWHLPASAVSLDFRNGV